MAWPQVRQAEVLAHTRKRMAWPQVMQTSRGIGSHQEKDGLATGHADKQRYRLTLEKGWLGHRSDSRGKGSHQEKDGLATGQTAEVQAHTRKRMAWPQVRQQRYRLTLGKGWLGHRSDSRGIGSHQEKDGLATGQRSRATGSKVVIQTKGAGHRRHQERKTREWAVMEVGLPGSRQSERQDTHSLYYVTAEQVLHIIQMTIVSFSYTVI